jgi:hypothetical protein
MISPFDEGLQNNPTNIWAGHVTAQAVGCWLFNMEPWV